MESIEVPERYFCPNPLDYLTQEDIDEPYGSLKYYLESGVVEIDKEGKARWVKKAKNRFLQMYSVRFVKSESGEKELEFDQICGRIVFDVFQIFERKSGGNSFAINKNGFVRLTGPKCPVDGWSHILLFPRLYRANQTGDFYHPDNPVAYRNKYMKGGRRSFGFIPPSDYVGIRGKYILNPDFKEKPSDELIMEEIETSVGKMKYSYAIFEDAVDSFVTVKLIEWRGKEPAPSVYGRICASNTRLPEAESTIFHRERREAISVSPQHYIPIDRPVNIVSMGHSLRLSVRILHRKKGGDYSVIANHSYSVIAQCVTYGRGEDGITDTREFGGEWGKVQVNVYFLPFWSKAYYDVEEYSDDD